MVRVVNPVPADKALTVELTGSVTLKEKVTVVSEVVGRVDWVSPKFEPGGSLEANEVFLKVDPAEYKLKVEEARLRVEALEHEIRTSDAAADDFRATEFELRMARVALELAELQLERTEISLPYTFRVISSSVEVGELAGPADIMGRAAVLGLVYRPESIRLDVPIDQYDLEYLRPAVGRSAEVRANGRIYSATVKATSSLVAPKSRLASLFLKFSDELPADSLPLPNTFAEVAIDGPSFTDVFSLPETASRAYGNVWIVKDGALDSVSTRTLGRTDDEWIVEPFDTGDGVVVGVMPDARVGLEVTAMDAGG